MVAGNSDLGRSVLNTDRSQLEHWASTRCVYLDNLKVALIAVVIALHAVLGYAGTVEVWTYAGVREATLSPAVEIPLLVLVSPFGFFLMALLFLVAGLLTPASYDRKGPRRFVSDRLLRLGVPFVIYVFLVQPALVYALLHSLGEAPGSFWEEYLVAEGQVDTGPLWFVGVLLLYSLGYAGWRLLRLPGPGRTITAPTLAVTALVVAPASFVVRLVYPYGSEAGASDLNFWEWPACVAVFALGAAASRQGWLTAVPRDLARRCRALTLCAVVAMAAVILTAGELRAVEDVLGGRTWFSAAFVVVEAMLTVFGSVWLLDVAQRRLRREHRAGPALARSAYAAFMLQTVFLLGLAMVLRPSPLPAEAKASLVAVGAVVASFAVAWLSIKKVPGVSRVL